MSDIACRRVLTSHYEHHSTIQQVISMIFIETYTSSFYEPPFTQQFMSSCNSRFSQITAQSRHHILYVEHVKLTLINIFTRLSHF